MHTALSHHFLRKIYAANGPASYGQVVNLARALAEEGAAAIFGIGANVNYLCMEMALGKDEADKLDAVFKLIGIDYERNTRTVRFKRHDEHPFWEVVQDLDRVGGASEVSWSGTMPKGGDPEIHWDDTPKKIPASADRPQEIAASPSPTKDALEEFRLLWNSNKALTACKVLNEERRKKLRELLRTFPQREQQEAIVAEAGRCRFTNESGKEWVPHMDWLLQKGKAVFLYERSHNETNEKRAEKFLSELDVAADSHSKGPAGYHAVKAGAFVVNGNLVDNVEVGDPLVPPAFPTDASSAREV